MKGGYYYYYYYYYYFIIFFFITFIFFTFAFFFLFYGTSIILSLYRVHVGFHVLPVDALVLMHIVLRARFPSTQWGVTRRLIDGL